MKITLTAAQADQLLQALPGMIQLGEAIVVLVRDLLVANAPDDWVALHAELLADEAILTGRTSPAVGPV